MSASHGRVLFVCSNLRDRIAYCLDETPLKHEAHLSEVPVHIVTHASQLPPEFLHPSSERQLVIGFDCEGVDLCRHGTLCIMQLAFPVAIYLVNAIQGGEMLVKACKPALESSYITKVIHDCKRDSEALYFQFGIKLNNVMDTQIAFSLIEEQEGRLRSPDDYISFVSLLKFVFVVLTQPYHTSSDFVRLRRTSPDLAGIIFPFSFDLVVSAVPSPPRLSNSLPHPLHTIAGHLLLWRQQTLNKISKGKIT
ncbi:Exonuclease 3'-5' domain-containing protein 1 [Morus notabilis]|uniref:Exonuclease 3'-5' domain-containing protein 1 n=1 Tax=Morus notabilis TaxID=981085 RepID=W9R0F5_9ROSA|nr:Exonuclease 3'-5' domain-containing protein 1 [Morus notabilis]